MNSISNSSIRWYLYFLWKIQYFRSFSSIIILNWERSIKTNMVIMLEKYLFILSNNSNLTNSNLFITWSRCTVIFFFWNIVYFCTYTWSFFLFQIFQRLFCYNRQIKFYDRNQHHYLLPCKKFHSFNFLWLFSNPFLTRFLFLRKIIFKTFLEDDLFLAPFFSNILLFFCRFFWMSRSR